MGLTGRGGGGFEKSIGPKRVFCGQKLKSENRNTLSHSLLNPPPIYKTPVSYKWRSRNRPEVFYKWGFLIDESPVREIETIFGGGRGKWSKLGGVGKQPFPPEGLL